MNVTTRIVRAVCVFGLLSLAAGCASSKPEETIVLGATEQTLAPGDMVSVVVSGEMELSDVYLVDEWGRISDPLLGEIPVAGLTPSQLEAAVAQSLTGGVLAGARVEADRIAAPSATPGGARREDYASYDDYLQALQADILARETLVEQFRSQAGLASGEGGSEAQERAASVDRQLATLRQEIAGSEALLGAWEQGRVTEDANLANQLTEFSGLSRDQLANLPAEDLERLRTGLQNDVSIARDRVAALERERTRLDGELVQQSPEHARLQELERETDAARSAYEIALADYDTAVANEPAPPAPRAPPAMSRGIASPGDAAGAPRQADSGGRFGGLFSGLFGSSDDAEQNRVGSAVSEPAVVDRLEGGGGSRALGVSSVQAGPFGVGAVERTTALPPMSLVDPQTLLDDGATPVRLLFGTNRAQQTSADVTRLTPGRSQELLLGAVTVSIPTGPHVVGSVERPGEIPTPFGPIYTTAESPERHFMMRAGSFLTARQFAELGNRLQRDAQRFDNQAVVFVHGFNNGFEDAAYRTAQIVHDLQFDGAAYFYAWPSRGELSPTAYRYDRESVLASRTPFKQFLRLIADSSGAERIHVIAHSMGALLTMEVLRDLNEENRRRRDPIFAEVVLAAPDIDRDVFVELAQAVNGVADGVTVYASAVDTALQLSQGFAGSVPRAGDVPPDGPVIVTGVDTIDATAVSTDLFYALNHARFAEATAIIDDLDELLREGRRPPELRTPLIEPVAIGGTATYWRFRALPR